jgi:hypothetical protein
VLAIAPNETHWPFRPDPAHDYSSVVWWLMSEWSFDDGVTWAHWTSTRCTGIIRPRSALCIRQSAGSFLPKCSRQPTVSTEGNGITTSLEARFLGRFNGTALFTSRRYTPYLLCAGLVGPLFYPIVHRTLTRAEVPASPHKNVLHVGRPQRR